jgi:hypothetical protein
MAIKENPVNIGALSAIQPDINAMAADPTSSKSILASMQKRLDDLNSPHQRLEDSLQKMHAWTLYDKQPAFKNIDEQQRNRNIEAQNIGNTMAQIGLRRDQLNKNNEFINSLKNPQAQGPNVSAIAQSFDPKNGTVQINGNAVRLNPMEIQAIANFNDPSLDPKEMYKAYESIVHIYSRADAEAKASLRGAAGQKPEEGYTLTIYDKDGKRYDKNNVTMTPEEYAIYKEFDILPKSFTDRGYFAKPPKVQKKATGGLVQGLAGGSQPDPTNAPLSNLSAPPTQAQPGILENILNAVVPSAHAVSNDPNEFNRTHQKQQQIISGEQGTENLKSSNRTREAELNEMARQEAQKKKEYQGAFEPTENTLKILRKLKENGIGNQDLFNIQGSSLPGALLSTVLGDVDPAKAVPGDPMTRNDLLAKWTLLGRKEKASKYASLSSDAQAAGNEVALNLAKEGSSRLTNMDLGVGAKTKGVGPNVPYGTHMENLASHIEDARTMQLRGEAFNAWIKKNPLKTTSDFHESEGYKNARKQARQEVIQEFKDHPEAYQYLNIHKDKNTGRRYYVYDGKSIYLE